MSRHVVVQHVLHEAEPRRKGSLFLALKPGQVRLNLRVERRGIQIPDHRGDAAQVAVQPPVGDPALCDACRTGGHVHLRHAQIVHIRAARRYGSHRHGIGRTGYHTGGNRPGRTVPADHHRVDAVQAGVRCAQRQRQRGRVFIAVPVDQRAPGAQRHAHAARVRRHRQRRVLAQHHAAAHKRGKVGRPVLGPVGAVAADAVKKARSFRHAVTCLSPFAGAWPAGKACLPQMSPSLRSCCPG